ncbi:sugar ABC transporter permease [Jiangella rhizosphaerae]|uniref:Sugar ABC transporter permease n=1 Tax=Jiangella rhizosphaerae TaxID=2293569 RepID=A0A418KM31_9ACTN|nr:sugar ABC transporter permease [Jiangella rhizosphaerae]
MAVLVGVFVMYPIVDTVGISLTDYNGLQPGNYVGLRNYGALLDDPTFATAIVNSAVIAAAVTVALTCIPLPLAYWIHRRIPFRRFFRAALYLPVVVPIIVSSVAWKVILDDHGILNYLLQWSGVRDTPVGWLTDPAWAKWSVIVVIVWRSLGVYLLIYLAYILTVPDELFEAAAVDGASGVRTFFSVVVPLMRPAILLCTIVSLANSLKAFDEVYVLTSGGPLNASKNVAYLIWETAFENLEFGAASAMAVVLLLAVAVVVGAVLLLARRRSV